jgi:hypothetical protein
MSISCWLGPTSWWAYSVGLLEREHGLAAQIRAGVERGQVEVAPLVEHLRRLRALEVEELELGPDVVVVEAHRLGPLDRAPQHVAWIPLVRRALGREDVAEHPCHPLLLRTPGQEPESGRVGHRDHVRLLDRVEPGDRRAVEPHSTLERVGQLGGVDRERLELPEDVGEPEADESDVALLDERAHVVWGQRRSRGRHRATNVTECPSVRDGRTAAVCPATGWPTALSRPAPARARGPSGKARTRPSRVDR